jgi:hypothetical protein
MPSRSRCRFFDTLTARRDARSGRRGHGFFGGPVHFSEWKLFSTAYADNYDTSLPEDLALIEEAVDLDVGLTKNLVLAIELHGIFRRRAPGAASQASSA